MHVYMCVLRLFTYNELALIQDMHTELYAVVASANFTMTDALCSVCLCCGYITLWTIVMPTESTYVISVV
jgi:hypothetical protein